MDGVALGTAARGIDCSPLHDHHGVNGHEVPPHQVAGCEAHAVPQVGESGRSCIGDLAEGEPEVPPERTAAGLAESAARWCEHLQGKAAQLSQHCCEHIAAPVGAADRGHRETWQC